MEEEEEEEERGGGVVIMVYDLQGEPAMFMTSPAVKSCSRKSTKKPARNCVQDHGQRQAVVPRLQGGSSSRFWLLGRVRGAERGGGRM